jgi:DNA replication protein DnaC
MNPYKVEELGKVTKHCPKHGDYEATEFKLSIYSKYPMYTICPKCEEERIALEKKIEMESIYKSFNIPERFMNEDFSTFETEGYPMLEEAKAIAQRYAGSIVTGRNLIIIGGPHTGKSHLAIAAFKEIKSNSKKYTNIVEILDRVKSTYSRTRSYTEERKDTIINQYASYDFLIIDNLEQFSSTKENMKILFEIINSRYDRSKNTIVCGELTRNGLRNLISNGLFLKLNNRGKIITLGDTNGEELL